jgi:hypothetical protein
MGEGVREVQRELLRSWQLSRKKREEKLNGGGGAFLAWPTTAASPQITMEIHISNWTHKFQNKTGLDAKANSELCKSNRVCSVYNI